MDKKLVARIIPIEREAAWVMTLFAAVTIITGYALTKSWFDRVLAQDIHFVAEWFFIALFIVHVVVNAIIVRFPLRSALKGILEGKSNTFAWTKVVLVVSGWASLISLFLVIASGLDWYAGVSGLLPFTAHLQYDIFLTVSLIIHVAAGAKLFLLRKGVNSRLVDCILVAVSVLLILGVIYIDNDGFTPGPERSESMEIKPAIPVGENIHPTEARTGQPFESIFLVSLL